VRGDRILRRLKSDVAQLVWRQPAISESGYRLRLGARVEFGRFVYHRGSALVVANFGSGMGAHIGAARLLYGMGRSNALPRSFFGAIDLRHQVPRIM